MTWNKLQKNAKPVQELQSKATGISTYQNHGNFNSYYVDDVPGAINKFDSQCGNMTFPNFPGYVPFMSQGINDDSMSGIIYSKESNNATSTTTVTGDDV